ncbi:hypothetical protein GWI72_17725 [Microvirga tunisiensis]|uniref:von Hippel-Lindau disease tumour suppressor beta domain-containing protein n=1 Tax=Pannonibacter tanglangensis TaxID=2750084 RepID=A0A7X5F5I2_9HYPH|nr:MliC family protein [Pannonibacter sp. XCT-53]NBN80121.1 hypothetical protein [Pannonibacter sp. XCT-53]
MRSTKCGIGPGLGAIALAGLAGAVLPVTAGAQSLPQQIQVQVVPAEPGIRSILVNKRYRPIISRGIEGAVVETVTGNVDAGSVGCDVELEVTLENSRVLRRNADICGSGGKVVVDVNRDPGPARPRVVGTEAATPARPAGSAPAQGGGASGTQTTGQGSGQTSGQTGGQTTPQTVPQPTGQAAPAAPAAPLSGTQTGTAATAPAGSQPATALPGAAPVATPQTPAGAPGTLPATITDALAGQPPLAPAPVERDWSVSGVQYGSQSATLLHAGPQGVDPDFQATCTLQSGVATVRLMRPSPGVTPGARVPVIVKADEFYATYDAVGSQGSPSLPEFTVSMTDPLWDTMARKSQLEVILDNLPQAVSLRGSAQPVRQFAAGCAEAQQIVEESRDPALANAGELSCSEFGAVRSLDGGFRGRMVFRNARNEPVDVFWIDYSGSQRFYARLMPGQVLDQESILSNAWLVTNASGQCLGLHVSRAPRQDVVIGNRAAGTPGSPAAAPAQLPMPAGPLPPAPVGGLDTVNYLCTAGIDLQVVFDAARDVAVVTEFGQISVTLPRVASGSGFRYASGGYTFAGQRDNATWSRPGLYDAFCGRN